MSALPSQQGWTAQQYLDFERAADTRHEFIDGQLYAMAGASERHNQITSAVHYLLYGQLLDQSCQVFQSDMRVQVREGMYFYPDLVVVCGEARYYDDKRDLLLNPTAIIEVLSPSTQDFDRGTKLTEYRTIDSLQNYALIAQAKMQVDHYTRQTDGGWLLYTYTQPNDRFDLPSIGCSLTLADIYRAVTFEDAD